MPLSPHLAIGWLLVISTLGLVGFYVPAQENTIGESYLIFFLHFPSAVTSLILFLTSGVLSATYLTRRNSSMDMWAATAVEVGLLGCTVTLVTGSAWARAAWGLWWDSADPRLMTVAIMWLTYVGYVVLRSNIEEPAKRAQFSAVFGVLAAVNVPLVYFAIRIFRQVHHPAQVTMGQQEMTITRWFGVLAFLVLYTALWRLRYRFTLQRHRVRQLEEEFARRGF